MTRFIALPLIAVVFLFGTSLAALGAEEVRVPEDVTPGLAYLLRQVGPDAGGEFKPGQIARVLDFVDQPKPPRAQYVPDPLGSGAASYLDFDVRLSMEDLLRYTFSPQIPWFATTPSSLRTTAWKKTEKPWKSLPRVWELLNDAAAPIVIRGVETVENTPDLTSGGYHRYDMHRTLVLFRHDGRRVFLSLARQAEASEVGKKGYIIGDDGDWNYFYSGEPGLSTTGLGWVKSYMFDSVSVTVFAEKAGGAPGVRIANFKWLRAGWSGLNVVNSGHIHLGLRRYAKSVKDVLESPRLPAVKTLEEACRRIANLSEAQIREKIGIYRDLLEARSARLDGGARKNLPGVFWDDGHWARMSREEMESVLVLETLKTHLGRAHEEEARQLVMLPPPQPPNQGG
jgi:hypothetical protein